MDTKTICEIIAWIVARCDEEPEVGKLIGLRAEPIDIFRAFCDRYTMISPYPKVRQKKVEDGCRFVYWSGSEKDRVCSAKKAEGSSHCRFQRR